MTGGHSFASGPFPTSVPANDGGGYPRTVIGCTASRLNSSLQVLVPISAA